MLQRPLRYNELDKEQKIQLEMARKIGLKLQFWSVVHTGWRDRGNLHPFNTSACYRIKPSE